MTEAHLNIVIDETGKAKVNYSGDMAKMARAIIRLSTKEEEFALALNTGIIVIRDHIEAMRLRDEMIGVVNNSEV